MAAPVLPLQPLKVPAGLSTLTPEQTYWKTFKNPLLIPSPSNNPINHVSQPLAPSNPLIAPSDTFAVTTGARVQIYDSRTRKLVKTITRFDDVAHSGDIRYDGRVLVAGDESGAIQVFDTNSRAILKTWKEHQQPVWGTKFSPYESTSLVSVSDDSTVRLWDLPSQESVIVFRGHTDYVRSGGYMPGQSSSLLFSGSYDQTVRLWDPRSPGRSVMTFKHAAAVEAVLPMPSGTTLLAAADNQISVLDVIAGKPQHVIQNHQKTVTALSLASNSTRLISGALDGHVKIFETMGWNVVAGSKYSSPVLSLSIITSGSSREDKHLAVGLQSGILSIKTRLSGAQKVRERERQKEMQALIEGRIEEHDRKKAKKRPKGWEKRLRGRKFIGEGADIVIEGNERHKPKTLSGWELALHKGHYQNALDQVLSGTNKKNSVQVMTLLTALRHRSALRFALSDRDEESIQPILKWTCTSIANPRTVELGVEVGMNILDLYSGELGQSKSFDELVERLRTRVRDEVERSQQAWQTRGMLGMLTGMDG
jgi:U3 small nucleolar RNA-associated protein 15